jgi:hypothetical protein
LYYLSPLRLVIARMAALRPTKQSLMLDVCNPEVDCFLATAEMFFYSFTDLCNKQPDCLSF